MTWNGSKASIKLCGIQFLSNLIDSAINQKPDNMDFYQLLTGYWNILVQTLVLLQGTVFHKIYLCIFK